MSRIRLTLKERVWRQVQRLESGCWIWTGHVPDRRYGSIRDHLGRNYKVHRLTYQWAHGPIPDGMVIDHLCENKLCVRPDHLEAVTPRTNNRRIFNRPSLSLDDATSITLAGPTQMTFELTDPVDGAA